MLPYLVVFFKKRNIEHDLIFVICHIRVCCYDQARDFQLPRSYLVKQCKDDLNKVFYIERNPGIANGASLNFEDELSCVIGK